MKVKISTTALARNARLAYLRKRGAYHANAYSHYHAVYMSGDSLYADMSLEGHRDKLLGLTRVIYALENKAQFISVDEACVIADQDRDTFMKHYDMCRDTLQLGRVNVAKLLRVLDASITHKAI